MQDLFASNEEAKEERLAMADPSIAEDDIHKCEIQSIIRRFYPDGKAAAAYFELVEKHRGNAPATRLKNDCRVAWGLHREKVDMDKEGAK